jgi:hypothetical protein
MTKLLQGFSKWFKKVTGYKKTTGELRSAPKAEVKLAQPIKTEARSPLIQKKRGKVNIQVGLDFGTSATKIMYSQLGRRGTKIVRFNHSLPNYPSFCLPSVAAINDQGCLILGIEAANYLLNKEWDIGFQRFKVIVAGNHDHNFLDRVSSEKFYEYSQAHRLDETFTAERLTALYLAHVMKKTRNIISDYPEYRDMEIDMAFNICIPIDHIQNSLVKAEFEKIFLWAEKIEGLGGAEDGEFDIIEASYQLENKPFENERRVHSVPEAVASFASYLISLRRQEGLHAVIDMGAGTTDISICNLKDPYNESMSYWYAARNIPYGTIGIERLIAGQLKIDKSECTCHKIFNCLNNMSGNSNEMQKEMLRQLKQFKDSKEYVKTWGMAYGHLAGTSLWEKVEVFLSGGGAYLPPAKDVFSEPWIKLTEGQTDRKVKYNVSPLPTPDDFNDAGTGAPFGRMAVAYGLTRPIPVLSEYVLPNDSPDHTPVRIKKVLPDRDDLYPK